MSDITAPRLGPSSLKRSRDCCWLLTLWRLAAIDLCGLEWDNDPLSSWAIGRLELVAIESLSPQARQLRGPCPVRFGIAIGRGREMKQVSSTSHSEPVDCIGLVVSFRILIEKNRPSKGQTRECARRLYWECRVIRGCPG